MKELSFITPTAQLLMATLDIFKEIATFREKRQANRDHVEIMLALRFHEEG